MITRCITNFQINGSIKNLKPSGRPAENFDTNRVNKFEDTIGTKPTENKRRVTHQTDTRLASALNFLWKNLGYFPFEV